MCAAQHRSAKRHCAVCPLIVYPRETPPHTRTARAQPPTAHRRRHSHPHHRRHGEHSPTARQPHSIPLKRPMLTPKEGPYPESALRHVDAGPSAVIRSLLSSAGCSCAVATTFAEPSPVSKRDANYRLPTSSCSPPRHPIGRPFGIALSSPILPHFAISISRICESVRIAIFINRENLQRVLPVESHLAVCSVARFRGGHRVASSLRWFISHVSSTSAVPRPGVYFWISRLYFTCIPPVSHRILRIPCVPVSIYI